MRSILDYVAACSTQHNVQHMSKVLKTTTTPVNMFTILPSSFGYIYVLYVLIVSFRLACPLEQ
jgi:hypothetical protein